MREALKKFFNKADKKASEEVGEMKKEEQQPALAAPETATQLANALEAFSAQTEVLEAAKTKIAELNALLESTKASLETSEASRAELAAQVKQTKLQNRRKAIEASLGTEKAEAILSATETIGDTEFNSVLQAISKSFELESTSKHFTELGVSSQADANKVVDAMSTEAQLLREKYKK